MSRSAVIGKVHRLGITAREAPVRTRSASVRVPGRTTVRPQVVRTAAPASPRAPIRVAVELSATSNILGLEVHSCRWPIGNPDQNDFGFCGREKLARGSYCDLHAQGAFRRCLSRVELDAWAQGASAGRRLQQSRP